MNFLISKEEREEYLENIRQLRDRYKPLIEERTGIDLGIIGIRDHRNLVSDLRNNSEWCKEVGFFASKIAPPLIELAKKGIWTWAGVLMLYNRSNIYVSDKILSKKELEGCLLHELSHHLWVKSGGEAEDFSNKKYLFNLLNEGYATYGERVWFSDFKEFRDDSPVTGGYLYEKGFEVIGKIVEEKGEDVLFHIPKNWREFEEYL